MKSVMHRKSMCTELNKWWNTVECKVHGDKLQSSVMKNTNSTFKIFVENLFHNEFS